jgi:hypothetical protein
VSIGGLALSTGGQLSVAGAAVGATGVTAAAGSVALSAYDNANGGGVGETFNSFEDATGRMNGLKNIDKVKTKNQYWKDRGFTEKWIGQDPYTGEWYSAFYNPKTGQFSGGKLSSRTYY